MTAYLVLNKKMIMTLETYNRAIKRVWDDINIYIISKTDTKFVQQSKNEQCLFLQRRQIKGSRE